MTRGLDRRARPRRRTGEARPGPAGLLLLVVATPADAIALLGAEPPGVPVGVVCLGRGGAGEREALDAALSAARDLGHRITGEPYVADSGGDPEELLLDVFLDLGPTRVGTLDPDPMSTAVEGPELRFEVVEPPERGRAALAAVRAARAYQEQTGRPVYVDCRRAAVDPRAPMEAASRYPRQSRWLTRGTDGRLSLHLLSAAGVLRWTETAPGGPRWEGPELLETPSELMPGLVVLQGADGYVRLIGLRRATDRGEEALEVVTATQYQSGRPLGLWQSIDNPHTRVWHLARQVGFPAAALDAEGSLHVFVRNVGHSVSTRRQDRAGRWSAWQHLRGQRVADEMAAFPGWDGGVGLVARSRDDAQAVHWYYDRAAGAWAEDRTVPVRVAPGSLAAAPEAGGVRFRYAETGEPCFWRPGAPAPVGLGGTAGSGAATGAAGAVLQGWPCTVLVQSGRGGAVEVGAHADGRPEDGTWWVPSGVRSLVAPAVALDAAGRVVVAVLDAEGHPKVTRRRPDPAGLEFGPWQTL
ncbi:hypothetical protein [Streptomyces roseolus]|uniref:hypothetical protein n=1 Tax=Streptomyces roseolus TaxID=67358 RepID=UPI00167A33E8|nr:hypothetical protein [Streptomyces roseolus]GGR46693.1 hypothetical protein GCM10010282_44460 [Streptomyces roseolus]